MNIEDKKDYFKVGKYYISNICYESYPCQHHVIEEGYLQPFNYSGLEIYKMLEEEGKTHEHFNSYKNYKNNPFINKIKKEFCEDDYKTNDYRKIGKYYVSTFVLKTCPPQHWVVYNNNGIEEKGLYLATDFLEKILKESLYDDEFEEYLTTIKNSKFMRRMNKYLPPERQFSEEEILKLQQKENEEYIKSQEQSQKRQKEFEEKEKIINKYKASSRLDKLKQKCNITKDTNYS
jgi:esterase/lipase superfamily enzyme